MIADIFLISILSFIKVIINGIINIVSEIVKQLELSLKLLKIRSFL